MARFKDTNWNLSENSISYEEAKVSMLMDLRDELKELNSLLRCSNFLSIPTNLRLIAVNTTKNKRARTKGKQ